MEKDFEKEERLAKLQMDLFWNVIFREIDRLVDKLDATEKDDAFKKLFYDGHRAKQIEILKDTIIANKNTGINYLVEGIAGVGKTTFIERLIAERKYFNANGVHISYVRSINKKKDDYLAVFVEELSKYFDALGNPYKGRIDTSTYEDICRTIDGFACHINGIENQKLIPIVFIDDLDYVEDGWKNIIDKLNHFIFSDKISICITMRPRLWAQLSNSDDRTTRNFDKSSSFTLSPIPISEIIHSKIFLILNEYEVYKSSTVKETFKKIMGYFSFWERADNTLLKILKSHGIDDIDKFQKIDYPFSPEFEYFLQKVTGYNLRRMFLIIKKSISFIIEGGELEENSTGVWKLKKSVIRDLFFSVENPDIEYNVLNLHFIRSEKTNKSICYYILLLMSTNSLKKLFEIDDEKFIKSISDTVGGGISNKNIISIIKKLSEKNFALLDLVKNTGDIEKYEISEKGRYYLNELSKWDEYIEIFGSPDEPIKIS